MPAGRRNGDATEDVADFNETIREQRSRYTVVYDPSHTFKAWRAKFYIDEVKCMKAMGVFDEGTILFDKRDKNFYTVRKTGTKGKLYEPQEMYQSTKQELVEAGING